MTTIYSPSDLDKLDWKLKSSVMETIVNNDGIIFGGAVRDMYLHDEHARLFYQKINKHELSDEKIEELYNNRSAYAHLFGRWIRPNDIDLTIHESKMEELLADLRKTFKVHLVFTREPKKYLPHLQVVEGDLTHVRYRIFPINNTINTRISDALNFMHKATKDFFKEEIKEFIQKINAARNQVRHFYLDIMVNMKPITEKMQDPPFGNLDFECNALLLKKDGYALSSQLTHRMSPSTRHQMMIRIMGDILKKRAVMRHSNVGLFRVDKMKKKGYTIIYKYEHIRVCTDQYLGYCVICHDDFTEEHHKLSCCDARYHNCCLVDASRKGSVAMVATQKCLMCKRDIYAIHSDIEAFISIEENGVTINPDTVD